MYNEDMYIHLSIKKQLGYFITDSEEVLFKDLINLMDKDYFNRLRRLEHSYAYLFRNQLIGNSIDKGSEYE